MSDFETDVGRIVKYMIEVNGITDKDKAIKVLDEVKKYFINHDKDESYRLFFRGRKKMNPMAELCPWCNTKLRGKWSCMFGICSKCRNTRDGKELIRFYLLNLKESAQ